jgi:glycogen debranching enzyme
LPFRKRTAPVQDVVQIENQFYILTTSARVDDRTRVLKHAETFALFDRFGDIAQVGMGELGIYHEGTRYLSRLSLRLGNDRPLLLSSAVREDNAMLSVDLTNPDAGTPDGAVLLTRGILHIDREKLLWDGTCYERIRIANYGHQPIEVAVAIEFDADFHDIFEVRGLKRARHGTLHPAEVDGDGVVLRYLGLDGVERCTRIRGSPAPSEVAPDHLLYHTRLEPRTMSAIRLSVACECGSPRPVLGFDQARDRATDALARSRADDCSIYTSNEQFNDWVNRSAADLHMMITQTAHGPYPYAGVPWYSTVFGRDGLITALETQWLDPSLARGVLSYLAAEQASEVSAERDAQPGKILHETRRGEMAALGEIPFGHYYGSVDATPLFVMLAGAYFRHTGDRAFIEQLWPHLERALEWIETWGDPDHDGFVDYERRSAAGLIHQGWKDSQDAVFHADGSPAMAPIALCEVQGYAYAARREASRIAAALGLDDRCAALARRAAELRQRFEQAFWCEEISTYALALDAAKQPCRVRTSNPGHCLFTGLVDRERGRRVADTLLGIDSFSGWGVRTVSANEIRYNPMAYHNGSVWPHDNALIGAGLARYGFKQAAVRILAGLFDASLFVDHHRLPELVCGFDRRPGEGPTLYPVACSPQAWASGAPFLLLQAALGLTIQASRARVCFRRPMMPDFLDEISLTNLRVGESAVDVVLRRHDREVAVHVTHRDGPADVVVLA